MCRSGEHIFNCSSTDQALEQVINHQGKSQGGMLSFRLRQLLEVKDIAHLYCKDQQGKEKKMPVYLSGVGLAHRVLYLSIIGLHKSYTSNGWWKHWGNLSKM